MIVIDPEAKASSVVKLTSEEDVTELMEVEEAGRTEEKTGAVTSQDPAVQVVLLKLEVYAVILLLVMSVTLKLYKVKVPAPDQSLCVPPDVDVITMSLAPSTHCVPALELSVIVPALVTLPPRVTSPVLVLVQVAPELTLTAPVTVKLFNP